MESATRHEHVGHTLLIDAAYHMYAEEPHGWAQTLADALDSGVPWPENLLICFAISLSKSHTIYGMRTGALVYLHPERGSIDRLQDVMGVTGRQTWSAAPRVAQHVLSELHATAEGEMHGHWNATGSQHFFESEDNLCDIVSIPRGEDQPKSRRFFAWYECEDPQRVVESCAQQHVYLVPLNGGVRIGLCAVPHHQIERVALALRDATEENH